jgi:Xaa-Pro aminopeptidase
MKSDLDALMQARNLDAILITGPAFHNPPMYYLTGGVHVTAADLIKKRGVAPILYHQTMERDEAAHTGLALQDYTGFDHRGLIKQCNGNAVQASAVLYQKMLTDQGITSGRLAVYGQLDAGNAYAIFSALQQLMPGLTLVGETGDSLLLLARLTKSVDEIERIRNMGRVTTAVVGQVAEFLTSHSVEAGVLIKPDGHPLTIGEVKRRINLWLAERDVENPEGTIFSIGRDSAVPHSVGNPADLLRQGQTIVFDIYPCEAGGGYFYDLTRTWCLGYASDETYQLYEDVLSVFRQVLSEMQPGTLYPHYHDRACDLFEKMGHPTLRTNPRSNNGFVHGLGHGVGLNIHERPSCGNHATQDDSLSPGAVVTIEPGLYYPAQGIGIRLEDTVWVNPEGGIRPLVEYPLDLVIPMSKVRK